MTEHQSCDQDPEAPSEVCQSAKHLITLSLPSTHHSYQPQLTLLSDNSINENICQSTAVGVYALMTSKPLPHECNTQT